jgi:hypothetical protein
VAIVFESIELLDQQIYPETDLEPAVLLALISYTELDDHLTSAGTQELAARILGRHEKQYLAPRFLVDFVLKGYIRPLFSGSKPSTVTPQGRKAGTAQSGGLYRQHELDLSKQPWRSQHVSTATIFGWVIKQMNVGS